MTHEELMELPIEHVSEKRYESETIEILFRIKEHSFRFVVHDADKEYYLGEVCHNGNSKPCLFCPATRFDRINCTGLGSPEIKPLLFERLIESNSIRLNWLYRTPRKNNKQER